MQIKSVCLSVSQCQRHMQWNILLSNSSECSIASRLTLSKVNLTREACLLGAHIHTVSDNDNDNGIQPNMSQTIMIFARLAYSLLNHIKYHFECQIRLQLCIIMKNIKCMQKSLIFFQAFFVICSMYKMNNMLFELITIFSIPLSLISLQMRK